MDILTYTSYEDVRAALGVSDEELDDGTLSLQLYANNLLLEMRTASVTLKSKIDEVSAIDEASRTDEQSTFMTAAHLFSTYAVAKHLCSTLPLFAPQEVGDGKASIARFSNPYKEVLKAVPNLFGTYKDMVLEALADLSVSSTTKSTPTFLAVAGLAVDRVTGE